MRCVCCDNILKPSEATRKFKLSGAYTDMCDKCLDSICNEGDVYTATVEGAGVDDDNEGEEE